jgi:uncharacterized protein (TIGR03435 family)
MNLEDMELLRQYARRGSEEAFAALVSRHVNLVYSVALRQTRDAAMAQEITQAVFVILARKADSLGDKTILPGWLCRTARNVAANALTIQRRRQRREQEAYMQSLLNEPTPEETWRHIAPLLDAALARLGGKDHDAIVLRFFENKELKQVGAALGVSEDAAKKRVSRALEKVRRFFLQRGVDSTAAAIGESISTHSIQAAPVALAKTVTAVVLAKSAAASASTLTLIQGALTIMAWTKTKTAIVVGTVILLAAGTATVTVVKERNAVKIERLWRINKPLSPAQVDNLPPMVKILPTKFVHSQWTDWSQDSSGNKFVGANIRAGWIATFAYGFPRGRVRFAADEPTNCFDFVATLPQGSREALQRWLKTRLDLVGRRETNDLDVLLLRVSRANAPGLQPAIPGMNDEYEKPGVLHASDEAMDTGAPRFEGLAGYLERYFKMPVIDQTGLTQHFSIHMTWQEENGHRNPEGLKQALLDQLGLELAPANMPIETLVVEKTK